MNTGIQHHQMVVKDTFPSGAQEWFCPTCGRHFIIQWPPNYKRIMLDEGDAQITHTGGTDGLVMGSADIQLARPESDPLLTSGSKEGTDFSEVRGGSQDLDDPYLSPWARWIGDKDI